MKFLDKAVDVWSGIVQSTAPARASLREVFGEVGRILRSIGSYLYKMRKIFLAIPVAWTAVSMAIYNQANLPDVVGLNMLSTGEFAIQVARELAVLVPLVITALCVLLMFGARRILTPWLVSVLSLFLPFVILLINNYPT